MQHGAFNFLFLVLTLGNTIVLGLDRVGLPEFEDQLYHLLNRVLTYCFLTELLIKLIGLGFKAYTRDYFNIFDALLVMITLVEEALMLSGLE